ncbi:beta-ketoacyl synthase N-terminal-like domain-containing protein [Spartinivicinus poritis]|uniref:Beta-ketoacyl synthase N-terminal-like domain-containing protein n=1 Tax=Spartinivicinus poritis TaxID=2994640 RepID=A0ABT5U8D6_9GAMM|nr:beta-ketoacyl synthase N-terminal-like domain-containing protein [Spartinivicinus sp. A2-2]MDE1462572.1 beta-ketoacyl synthase N-terminal-like domain-containing protein [Spartinivicinus sp. A2-2]
MNFSQDKLGIIQTKIGLMLAEELHLPADVIDPEKNFVELGLTSSIGMIWVSRINQVFGLSIPAVRLYSYPTLQTFSAYLLKACQALGQETSQQVPAQERQATRKSIAPTLPVKQSVQLSLMNPHRNTASIRSRYKAQGNRTRFTGAKSNQQRFSATHKECGSEKETSNTTAKPAIAIVGMSGKFPKANNVMAFWNVIKNKVDCISEVPNDRWPMGYYYDKNPHSPGKSYSKWMGLLDEAEYFDPLFFNISPAEAPFIDPQQRLFLEAAWGCLEDAGYAADSLSDSRCGVFVGCGHYGYLGCGHPDYQGDGQQATAMTNAFSFTGGSPSILAARVSYFLNLKGPCLVIDTACSASLVAIAQACNSLVLGDSDVALAGGVSAIMNPSIHIMASRAGMLSKEGRCFTLDQRANGFVPGEGVGVVALKRLEDAEKDNDAIYGVIQGWGVNQDGKTNGITAPNPAAQSELIKSVYSQTGINPEDIQLIEMHGTGTQLGDPVEVEALVEAFQSFTDKSHYCALGAVKSNIGHLLAAAGVAGVIKVLLAIKHRQLPPTLHFEKANPHIQLSNSPFYVNTACQPWEVEASKARTAAVSSFSFCGTNAHLVIAEHHALRSTRPVSQHQPKPVAVVLSAKHPDQLQVAVANLLAFIRNTPISQTEQVTLLKELAYTLQVGRVAMKVRLGIIATSMEALEDRLQHCLDNNYLLSENGLTQPRSQQIYVSHLKGNQPKPANQPSPRAQTGEVDKLLALWVEGSEVDWNQLYPDQKPRRIHLPTYPFARQRYRLATAATSKATEDCAAEPSALLLDKDWQPQELVATLSGAEKQPLPLNDHILVLITPSLNDLTKAIKAVFPNSQILTAEALTGHQPENSSQVIDWGLISGCLDLTGLDPNYNDEDFDWLTYLQAMIEQSDAEKLRCIQLTQGLENFNLATKPTLSGAKRVGLYRMLQNEYHKVISRHIDIDQYFSLEANQLIHCIYNEWLQDQIEPEVCYRQGRRFKAGFKASPLENTSAYQSNHFDRHLLFAGNDVVWITGGTRGLGMLCAKHWLKAYGARNFVLMGQAALPARESWPALVGSSDSDPVLQQKIRDIQYLESQGATVKVLATPLSDIAAIRTDLLAVKRELGPIKGVIHCAGQADFTTPAFIRKQTESIERLCEPKIKGLAVLHEVLKDEPLKYFVLFSSVSATIPTLAVGHSDYALANAYMDYFAQYQQGQGYSFYQSIQWPNWKQTGMGEVTNPVYQSSGLLSHTNQQGLKLLDHVLAHGHNSVLMPAMIDGARFNLSSLFYRQAETVKPLPIDPTLDQSSDKVHNRGKSGLETDTALQSQSLSITDQTITWLTALLGKELALTPDFLEPDKPIQEYGVDSIVLAQLVNRMDRDLPGLNIDPSLVLAYPTIESLSQYLASSHEEKLAQQFSVSNQTKPTADLEQDQASLPNIAPTQFSAEKPQVKQQATVAKTSIRKIAVIGMGCHFPDADNLDQYWQNLATGHDSIGEVPLSRWNTDSYYHPDTFQHQKSISKWGGFLADIEAFDPDYFGIDESLAAQIDPLERQWLEVSAEALADAGYEKADLWGKPVGVYVGSRTSNFASKLDTLAKDVLVGVGQNFIAAHLAHIYNFTGPNLVVDAACASALTAIHLAVQSLRQGESEIALAGGVDILLDEQPFITLSRAQVLSPDGRCKTFDEKANGIGIGEGCGVLVLKPLEAAIEDNNKIYGVIEGSAVNNDGNTMGVTTPNPTAQQKLIESAIADAQIQARSISYVETHGTGTLIGDPIELKALTAIFDKAQTEKQVCGVGSVKSNIGHLLSAAGVASVIKVLLSMVHRKIPPTLHCQNPNPRFDFDNSPLYPVLQLKDWKAASLRAGISSFGLGGNNAHLIISDEGIPANRLADTQPRKAPVIFQRKRYWPDPQRSKKQSRFVDKKNQTVEKKSAVQYLQNIQSENAKKIIHTDETVAQKKQFMRFFELVK